MDQEHKLPDLPPSKDKFWEKAEINLAEVPVRRDICEHHFIHRTSQEVLCRKCKTGYFLSEGMNVRDGRIWHHEALVI